MTQRNPNLIPLCHLHELLFLSLLLPVPPQHSLAHLFWLASHSSQLLTPHNRESGDPGFCTSHSVYVQSAPHSHRRSTFPYLRPSCWRGRLLIFRSSSSRFSSPQRGDPSFRSWSSCHRIGCAVSSCSLSYPPWWCLSMPIKPLNPAELPEKPVILIPDNAFNLVSSLLETSKASSNTTTTTAVAVLVATTQQSSLSLPNWPSEKDTAMQTLWLTHRLDLRLIDISGGAIAT